jgi:hypothetical protein
MLIHYFITGLKPIGLNIPLPMSTEDFLKRAEDSLSGHVLLDLTRLALYKDKVASIRAGSTLSAELWWSYWQMIKLESKSPFLRSFAQFAVELYAAVALILSDRQTLKNELDMLDTADFHEMYRHPDWDSLKNALHHDDPMVLEKAIIVSLFRGLDEIASPDIFSYDQVFSYFIKLLMCERLQSFDGTAGQNILLALIQSTIEGINHA